MKKLLFTIIGLLSITLAIYYTITRQDRYEMKLNKCIKNILINSNHSSLQVKTKGREKFPIISGSTISIDKKALFDEIYQECNLTEIQDFIQIIKEQADTSEWLNFQVDDVNGLITVTGKVKRQQTADNILSSFADTYPNMSTAHDIGVDKNLQSNDLDIHVTLLLTAIEEIKLKDISIKNGKLSVKGLVRNAIKENQTILKLNQLFKEDLIIINQLEQVIHLDIDEPDIDIKPLPIPQISIDSTTTKIP